MQDLNDKILQWGRDRNIIGQNAKATLLAQLDKSQEELNEARDAAVIVTVLPGVPGPKAEALLAESRLKLKDGIGDTYVTLVLLADLAGMTVRECVEAAYDEIKGRTGKMINGQFLKDSPVPSLQPE